MPTPFRPENSPERLVFAGQTPLVTELGHPYPPADVVAELQRTRPTWKIEWVEGAFGTSCFCIKEAWRQDDKRWARVQCGECDPANAFDIIIRFPLGIRTGDMLAWIDSKLGIVRDPVKEAARRVEEAQKAYERAQEAQVNAAVDTGTRRILDESDHLRLVRGGFDTAHPMVPGAEFTPAVSVAPEREPKRLLEVG